MKRDWDLIRQILLNIEEKGPDNGVFPEDVEGWDERIVSLHIALLVEADLILGLASEQEWGIVWIGHRLTRRGHELVDSIRSDSDWSRVRDHHRERGISMSLETIKFCLTCDLQELFG